MKELQMGHSKDCKWCILKEFLPTTEATVESTWTSSPVSCVRVETYSNNTDVKKYYSFFAARINLNLFASL